MINYKMPDDNFNLKNVSDADIFNALKCDITNAIKKLEEYKDITSEFISLNPQYTIRQKTFGKDKNLYNNIILFVDVKSYLTYDNISIIINPFEIQLAPSKDNFSVIEDEQLTKSFINFMKNTFPNSEYNKKREKYFNNAKTSQSVEENLLFSK